MIDSSLAPRDDATPPTARPGVLAREQRALWLLARANQVIIRATSESELFERMCRAMTELAGFPLAWVGLIDDEPPATLRVVARAGEAAGWIESLPLRFSEDQPIAQGPTGRALRLGTAQVSHPERMPFALPIPLPGEFGPLAACAAYPLRYGGRVIGSFSLYSQDAWAFDDIEATMWGELVSNLEVGLSALRERAEREATAFALQATRERNRQQRDRIEALESTDRYKDEFLSVISHELRTPLNVIAGFTGLLDEEISGGLNADQRGYLAQIAQASKRMAGMVDNLLDLSRMVIGRFHVVPTATPYKPLVRDVLSLLEHEADHAGVTLGMAIDPALELEIDGLRIHQVLSNLVGNAIKFTPAGGRITVSGEVRGDRLQCEVADTGSGIPEALRDRLFKRFSQLDMSSTRLTQGAGLGLAIARSIVEAHGGEIGVRSTPGQGSTFWFSLPLVARHPAPRRLLIVDPDPVTQEGLREVIRGGAHHATFCPDTRAALERLREAPDCFDLVVLDVGGEEHLADLRALRHAAPADLTRIAALSAEQGAEFRHRVFQAGADAVLRRPFFGRDLIDLLAKDPRREAP